MNPWIGLDPGTLHIAAAVLAWLVAAIAASSIKVMPRHGEALRAWSFAMAASGGGFLFYALRGAIPFALSLLAANTLLLLSVGGALRALALLTGESPGRGSGPAAVVGLGLAGVWGAGLLGAPLWLASLTVSFSGAVLYIWLATAFVRQLREYSSPVLLAAAGVAGFVAACFAGRALMTMLGESAAVLPSARTPLQVATLLGAAVLVVMASMAFFTLAHELHARERIELVSRDNLTGLFLRTGFLASVARQSGDLARHGVTVVMVDLDEFKQINTRHSYEGGDRVLAHAARRIATLARLTDTTCRWGGEEFCIVLPGAGPEVAEQFAERLVQDARQQRVRMPSGEEARYTLSAGFAVLAPGDWSVDAVMRLRSQADEALRAAKISGRDRAQAMPALTLVAAA